MAVMEAQQWADKMENKEELATIMAKRQWINCPVEDIADRAKGKFDYGNAGKVVENSPHIMKYWRDLRLLSVPEPRSLVHDRRTSGGANMKPASTARR